MSANSGELTNAELALLNNLLYIDGITNPNNDKVTVIEYISRLRDQGLDKLDDPESEFDLTAEEWDQIFTSIENDPSVANLTMEYPSVDDNGGKVVTFVDNNDNATVVFRGTSGPEWADNVVGAYQEDTDQQQAALDYIKELPYTNITVTGHSKGGNKAQYVTIVTNEDEELAGKIDRCVAFDGQGFSPEFCKKYADEIAEYASLITLICPKDDYVNILLEQIAGNVIYTEIDESFWDRLKNGDFSGIVGEHKANRMLAFDEDGNAYIKAETTREPIMTALHEFILYLEDNVSDDEKVQISEWAAGIVSKIMNGKKISLTDIFCEDGIESIKNIAKTFIAFVGEIDPDIKDQVTELVKRIIKNREITDADYEELAEIMELIAEDVDTTYNNDLENNSTNAGSFTSSTSSYRDFSDGVKEELKELVNEVESENPLNITKWDVWYRVEKYFGNLTIDNYADDIDTYYRKIIDINGTTVENIETIFNKVNEIDSQYKNSIETCAQSLVTLKNTIDELSNSMTTVDVEVSVK